ncbi:MAPK-interacting and spindle-stabilizing protein-like isoform X1 [Neodiprion lecontei]|uniref:MAPK-interacting and spindle-stabilizing protein-like isoform X1 n=1 Tax=Neodiprion lecontei TaxID=441921 RepID=A0A6J0C1F7_NEOLC|nr:MAPK-interacting and spindle-stabilizing protein-like isoform X1 [Neodiprion lecontei]XP_015520357.1 MAPK-interacting and spindle-stabilizing protein-like isoform X1 [Neodiprion lecontei]XP_046586308.1 MAPK-interacting and spindle-stabilizing protein-like isoform X1 [Neodiprion lecontei]XP_046586309.1 MAPK-interacting and spindle-stabilizing protein-like isoform X1 [Neodiprion lecontei]XP_046586310.1 MAPK-interacting and spindle-stabilizing protein-like isoform X1 [Neodiprion lecontei]
MDPSRFNGTTMASSKETEALRTTEQRHVGATSGHDSQTNPSASLLQFGQHNPGVPSMEPPPYSSVVTQDSQAWHNHPGTFSNVNGQAPYPTGPAPYPTDGAPAFEVPSKAPYPTAPVVSSPYPAVSGITSQPTFTPGPASQAPYPVAAMPMPTPITTTGGQIGFTNPLTTEPKSATSGYQPAGYEPLNNQGMIYPTQSGAGGQYYPVQNPYQQNQVPPPQTVYVVQKNADTSTTDDDCAMLACCLASCYCLCECLKICISTD